MDPSTAPQVTTHRLADRGGWAVLALTLVLFLAPMQIWLRFAPDTVPLGAHAELRMLISAALLALILPLFQIFLQIRAVGGPAVRGNREDFPTEVGVGGRAARAHRNLIESLVPFTAAVLAAQALGISNTQSVAASVLYLAARLVHALSYVFGITVLRSAAFYAGLISTVILLLQLPLLP